MLGYLDNWQKIETNEEYKKTLLDALSSLYTFVKSFLPANTTNRELFKKVDSTQRVKAERFDKLFDQVKMSVRNKFVQQKYSKILDSNRSIQSAGRKKRSALKISNKPDPRKTMLKFFQGSGNILDLASVPPRHNATTYSDNHAGKASRSKSKNMKEFYSTTTVGMTVIPNPNTLKKTCTKFNRYKSTLNSVDNVNHTLTKRMSNLRENRARRFTEGIGQSADFKYFDTQFYG